MSFDSLKKQKANLEIEKKKISASYDLSHPLAYTPKPKGKEEAVREQINQKKQETVDSLAAKSNSKIQNSQVASPPKISISADKNAASLFNYRVYPFVSGRRGKNVSDVFIPNKTVLERGLPRPIKSYEPRAKKEDVSEKSYPGYSNSPAQIQIKLKKPEQERVIEQNQFSQQNSAPQRHIPHIPAENISPVQESLPNYDLKEIYNTFDEQSEKEVQEEKELRLFVNDDSNFQEKQQDPWEDFYKDIAQQREKSNPAKTQNDPRPQTTIKLSFVRPASSIKLKVEDDGIGENLPNEGLQSDDAEVQEIPINNTTRNLTDNLEQQQVQQGNSIQSNNQPASVIDLSRVRTDSYKNRSGVKLPISHQAESVSNFLADYHPIQNDYFNYPQSSIEETNNIPEENLFRKIQKFSRRIFVSSKTIKDPTRIVGIDFHDKRNDSDREYERTPQEFFEKPQPPEIEAVPMPAQNTTKSSSWHKRLLTPKEEKVIRRSLGYTQKPVILFRSRFFRWKTGEARRSAAVLMAGLTLSLSVPMGAYVQKVIEAKNKVEQKSEAALQDTEKAKSSFMSAKPEEARHNFANAYQNFMDANQSINDVGGVMIAIIKVLPGGSKVESGQNLLEAGKHLTAAGQIISEGFNVFLGQDGVLKKKIISTDNLSTLKEVTTYSPPEVSESPQSLTDAIIIFQNKLDKAKDELSQANQYIDKVDAKDLPVENREEFGKLKDQLPSVITNIDSFSQYANFLLTVLGHNQPKHYLFLFENNDEMRATGGFIGTYGLMKINEGDISQLVIDGIYNPDGQLKERIVPPKPIQKMSATWSMHDANWWPDFPKSAEKVSWFYEKTGGPTVDGVIAFTPTIMKKFLEITGPIKMDKYDITVTADNFIDLIQYKVEVDYDKQQNRPKQILADLTPLVLEKIFNSPPEKWVQVLQVFSDCLEQRNIMLYFFDYNVQKKVSELGWSGEMLDTPKDYLSVVNTNISGLKTDKMIEQKIDHSAEVKPDGSIIDTVTISRTHRGGNEKYDWYNGVNSDWMRVYVPKGSELVKAEGYTREIDAPPVDYTKLGFVEDEMVTMEESGTKVDPYTGTRIYEDSGKTVFANWTYVSPGETLVVKYSYLLPFKLRFDDLKKPADTYSLLIQKQAGDENSSLSSEVKGLENFQDIYHYPTELPLPNWNIQEKFDKDLFAGVVLTEKGKNISLEK